MRIIYPFFILLISTSYLSFGQSNEPAIKKNSFDLGIGINLQKELNLLPKVHRGLNYTLGFSHLNNTNYFDISLQYARLKTSYEELSSSPSIQLNSSYTYFLYGFSKNKLSYTLGPEAGLNYNLSMYPNWDESHLYWADYFYLGIHNRLDLKLKEQETLSLELSVPFVSLISRPELNRMYKIDEISAGGIIGQMHSDLEFATINRSFFINSRLEYIFQINERISQAIGYSFNYLNVKAEDGNSFLSIQHFISLKLYY